MTYEKFNNIDDLLLFLDVENVKIDTDLRDVISKLFKNHNISYCIKHGITNSDKFRLTFYFSRKDKFSISLDKNFLVSPSNRIMSKFRELSKDEPLILYDVDYLLPLCNPILKLGWTVESEDENDFTIFFKKKDYRLEASLKPYKKDGEKGRFILYDGTEYLDTIAHEKLETLEDIKNLVSKCIDYLKESLKESNNFKYILNSVKFAEKILENNFDNKSIDFNKDKEDFLNKKYKEENYISRNGVEKLYDYFTMHDISTVDAFYEYLKKSVNKNLLESINFINTSKKLSIKFKNGTSLEIELIPEFSHVTNNINIFFWKPLNYIENIKSIKIIVNTDKEKAEIFDIKTESIYMLLLEKYNFLDISTTEDNLKRRIFLKKGLYTYRIFSTGLIDILYDNGDRSYTIVLEDGSYLLTIAEYTKALNLVLNNYLMFSKEYGFQITS